MEAFHHYSGIFSIYLCWLLSDSEVVVAFGGASLMLRITLKMTPRESMLLKKWRLWKQPLPITCSTSSKTSNPLYQMLQPLPITCSTSSKTSNPLYQMLQPLQNQTVTSTDKCWRCQSDGERPTLPAKSLKPLVKIFFANKIFQKYIW